MVFLLSLCSAVAYGLSDFVGGLLSKRASVWAVAATSQVTAAALTVGLLAVNAGEPQARDLAWGALAGVGNGVVLGAVVLSAPWWPRDRHSLLGAVAGLLAGIATVCFQLASQSGMLTIAAVVASLYPAATVVLAALVLREGIGRAQGVGLAFAAAAIVLIASG